MLERAIQATVCRFGRRYGVLCYKFASPGMRSVPDVLCLFEGRVWLIEFKQEGKRPTKGQLREHQKLRAAGVQVDVVDSVWYGQWLMWGFICDALI